MQFCRRAASRFWRHQFSSGRPKDNIVLMCTLRRHLKHSEKFVAGTLLLSAGWFGKSAGQSTEGNQDVVTMADTLYKQNRFREVYEILKEYKDTDDVEILWRLSRVEYNISQEQVTPAEEKKRLVLEAFELIEKALKLNDNHFATHKWMSILLDAKCGYDGLKARISNLETVKKHMVKASELNKKDATILYMIGLWCYQIADMPWYQRKIASTVFAKPPDSTYEEALEYFFRAEEVEPRFYSQNLLMLGKTYLKLKEEDKARYYLDLASNYPASTDDDQMARKEAHELLKNLKPQKSESVAV